MRAACCSSMPTCGVLRSISLRHQKYELGLSEALRSDTEQKLPVFELAERSYLPAGRAGPIPIHERPHLFERSRSVLDEAAQQFDWIIVDAPPAAPLADAG